MSGNQQLYFGRKRTEKPLDSSYEVTIPSEVLKYQLTQSAASCLLRLVILHPSIEMKGYLFFKNGKKIRKSIQL